MRNILVLIIFVFSFALFAQNAPLKVDTILSSSVQEIYSVDSVQVKTNQFNQTEPILSKLKFDLHLTIEGNLCGYKKIGIASDYISSTNIEESIFEVKFKAYSEGNAQVANFFCAMYSQHKKILIPLTIEPQMWLGDGSGEFKWEYRFTLDDGTTKKLLVKLNGQSGWSWSIN